MSKKDNVIDYLKKDNVIDYLLKLHKFEFICELGKGGFGSVIAIKVNGSIFAFKIVKVKKFDEKNSLKKSKKEFEKEKEEYNKVIHSIEKEFNYAKMLRGKYCIRTLSIYKDIYEDKKTNKNKSIIIYSAVMEKAIYSDLKYFIYYFYKGNMLHLNNYHKNFPHIYHINMLIIKFFAYQIIQCLDFLERHQLCHCDFKPENFLINIGFILKMSDFSLLKLIEKNKNVILTSSTWNIKSPEYYNENKEVKGKDAIKVDIFSFGLILYYMCFNQHLLDNEDKNFFNNKKNEKIEKKKYLITKINEKIQNIIKNKEYYFIDDGLRELIIRSIEPDIDNRITVKELLENQWLNQNLDIVQQIYDINDNEEIKLLIEFQKKKNKNKKINYKSIITPKEEKKRKKNIFIVQN